MIARYTKFASCPLPLGNNSVHTNQNKGADPAHAPPPKTGKTPKIFAPPSAIKKNMIFWRKIVIFHTKYTKKFRASLCSAQFF
jgi:hypothetical protein